MSLEFSWSDGCERSTVKYKRTCPPHHHHHHKFSRDCRGIEPWHLVEMRRTRAVVTSTELRIQTLPFFTKFRMHILCWSTFHLTYSMQQSPSWEANWFCSKSRNSPHFMEPESSLPYSQAPAICPYPGPTPSSPHNPFLLPEEPS